MYAYMYMYGKYTCRLSEFLIPKIVFNITKKRKTLLLFDIFTEWEMEKLNLKYCKHILGVTKLCTNITVLSELGRYPLYMYRI